jgi:hypothetical protein
MQDGRVFLVYQSDAQTWDPASGVWTKVASPPFQVSAAEMVALADGRMLLVGEGGPGRNSYAYEPGTRFQVWSPSTGTWSLDASWEGNGHAHRAVQLAGGDVLAIRTGPEPAAMLWSPTTSRLTPAAAPRANVEASTLTALADGRALHVGGPAPEVFGPAELAWVGLPSPRSPVSWHGAVRLADGRVLIAGGQGPDEMRPDHGSHLFAIVLAGCVLGLVAFAVSCVRRLRPGGAAVGGAIAAAVIAGAGLAGVIYLVAAIGRID